jgi:hypothetical protein
MATTPPGMAVHRMSPLSIWNKGGERRVERFRPRGRSARPGRLASVAAGVVWPSDKHCSGALWSNTALAEMKARGAARQNTQFGKPALTAFNPRHFARRLYGRSGEPPKSESPAVACCSPLHAVERYRRRSTLSNAQPITQTHLTVAVLPSPSSAPRLRPKAGALWARKDRYEATDRLRSTYTTTCRA